MFSKLKQFVGMVGVKVELDIPAELSLDTTVLEGVVRLSAKQDQHVTRVKVDMKQVHQEGSGDSKSNREFEIGELVITSTPFDIKAGETREFPFSMPFSRRKTSDQRLSEQGGVLGALGKVGKLMDSEKDNFWVNAMADVKGAALDPSENKEIKFK